MLASRFFFVALVAASAVAAATTIQSLPNKQVGMYLLLADDTVANYTSSDEWEPKLYDYQANGGLNVAYFTFINPATMAVPKAFSELAGKCARLQLVPPFYLLVGGYSYSPEA